MALLLVPCSISRVDEGGTVEVTVANNRCANRHSLGQARLLGQLFLDGVCAGAPPARQRLWKHK
jgi:hypothetical protein